MTNWRQILSWQGVDSLVGYLCEAKLLDETADHNYQEGYTLIYRENSSSWYGTYHAFDNQTEYLLNSKDRFRFPKNIYILMPIRKIF